MLIDTHCHLDFPEFDNDRKEVVKKAQDAGIGYIINIGSSLAGSKKAVELSKEFECIYATVGIHPHQADKVRQQELEEIKVLAKNDKVVAIGEIGLDYSKNFSKQENQRQLFIALLNAAKELNLPVVLHSREAQEDILKILKDAMPVRAVVHCFSGDPTFLKECLSLGFFISFTCNITYKKADRLRELVKIVPLERLFLETDAPYLSPEGLRGQRNEPRHVKELAEEIARLRGISFAQVTEATTNNAKKFFNIN